MKIYTQIYSKLVLTQFKLMVVLWRFEIATHEGTCFLVRGFQGDLDVAGLSTIPKVYQANSNSKTCKNSSRDKIQFGPKKGFRNCCETSR